MAHIRKQPGYPAYQSDEHGNPISPEDCAKPIRNVALFAAGLGGQQAQQDQAFFDMLQQSDNADQSLTEKYGEEGGNKKEKLKEKFKKKIEGGNKDDPPTTTAQNEKKIDPQLLSSGSQLKAMSGSTNYAKSGPK